MALRARHEVDPKIKVKHAIAFFEGKQIRLAECVGVYPSQVSMWANNPDELLQPLHAYRLAAYHPGAIALGVELQKREYAENEKRQKEWALANNVTCGSFIDSLDKVNT